MVIDMLFEERYSKCIINQPIVRSGEKGKCHYVKNDSGSPIFQYHIDGDIIKNIDIKKCDYIVEVTKDKSIAFIIELKGSHLSEAFQQIENTINHFHSKLHSYDIRPRIISKKVNTHSINNSEYRKFKKKYPDALCKTGEYTDVV